MNNTVQRSDKERGNSLQWKKNVDRKDIQSSWRYARPFADPNAILTRLVHSSTGIPLPGSKKIM